MLQLWYEKMQTQVVTKSSYDNWVMSKGDGE